MPLALADLRTFRNLMADTVTIAQYVGVDSYGQEQYGTAVPYRARVQGKNRNVMTAAGEEKVSSVTVYLGTLPTTITPLDLITLPARFAPTQPPILAIEHSPDEHGMHHVTVAC